MGALPEPRAKGGIRPVNPRIALFATLFAAMAVGVLLALAPAPAVAQAPATKKDAGKKGEVRVQGQRLTENGKASSPGPSAAVVDLREEMRKFVQSAAAYARQQRPDFAVVVEGGLDLLVKADEVDKLNVAPAHAYMRSIDGVIVPGLFFDKPDKPGAEPTPEKLAARLALLEYARAARLKIMTVDFVADADQAQAAIQRSAEKGFIPFPATRPIPYLNALPRVPARPYRENGESVISFPGVRNFMIMGDSRPFGREDEYALALHDTNFDALIVDVFHGRQPLSRQAVETLKYKKLGAKRLVLARIDLSSIAAGSFFWKQGWREGYPNFVDAPMAGDPDRHWVQYWRSNWQRIVTGNEDSYLFGVMGQGFDGAVLAGLDAYRHFEGGPKDEE